MNYIKDSEKFRSWMNLIDFGWFNLIYFLRWCIMKKIIDIVYIYFKVCLRKMNFFIKEGIFKFVV